MTKLVLKTSLIHTRYFCSEINNSTFKLLFFVCYYRENTVHSLLVASHKAIVLQSLLIILFHVALSGCFIRNHICLQLFNSERTDHDVNF